MILHPCCQCFSFCMLASSSSITTHLQTLFLGFLWLPADGWWLHNKRQKMNRLIPKSFTKAFMWQDKQHNNLFDMNISCYGTNFVGSACIIILHLIMALPLRCSCLKTKWTMLGLWLLTSKPCKQQEYVKSHPAGFCGAINNKHVCSSLSCVYHTGLI